MVQVTHSSHSLGDDIGLMTQIRQAFAGKLEKIADYLNASEQANEPHSGRLSLDNEIAQVRMTSDALRSGRFKIAVVGDMKRGKSTILNVLLGANFLPVDVTRCTAVLTVVRYGDTEKVTVHFTAASKRAPEIMTPLEFKEHFTLKPEIHRAFEELGQHAFPDVEYAEIETPNPFLEKGVQIIDTPGLNDTPELNQLTLEFAKDCNAILFVLNPQTMVTMQEKQYFEAHFAGRGLPVFFLVNRWDQIRHQLMDPDDPEEVQAAEEGVRRQIRSNVLPLLAAGDGGPIEERLHGLSSLAAWKRIVKHPGAGLEGTGFEGFYSSIGKFLKEGRIRAEMRSSRILTANTYREFHRKVTDRIGMLGTTRSEFEENYTSVQGLFDHLRTIREQVGAEFEQAEVADARLIASSLGTFIRGLSGELKSDFEMPDLSYWQTIKMIQPSEQQKFTLQLKDAYAKFFQQKLPVWERNAEEMIGNSIKRLQMVTEGYAVEYATNMNTISERLSGGSLMEKTDITADDSPWWTRVVAGGAALMLGDPLGAGMAAHKMFNWRDVARNVAAVVAAQILLFMITGGLLGPLGVLVVMVGVGIFNARSAVERLKDRITDALIKDLPNVAAVAEEEANRHIRAIYHGAQERVLAAIDADIESRRQEIENLRESMQKREIDKEAERKRLLEQDAGLLTLVNDVEFAEDRCLRALSDSEISYRMTSTDPPRPDPSSHRFLQVAAQNRKALACFPSAPPRLVVIGNFNAGKSTLINALLGKRLLPAMLKPTTGAVIRLVWGEEDRTIVRFLDGRMKTAPGTALLEEYGVIGAVGNTERVEDIQVETDAGLLRSGLMIVDVPGMEDDPGRYAAILREAMLADLVLSVHDVEVQMPWSKRTFLQEELIANVCASIAVIWNKCNLLDAEQQEAAVAGTVARIRGMELRPLEPLRTWYRLDALPELRQRLAGATPSAAFRTFEEDVQEALNADSLLLQQTRATRTVTLLAAVVGVDEEPAQEVRTPIVVWRDTACAAAERLLALAAGSGMETQTARLTSLVESLRAPRGNLLIQIRQVIEEGQSVRQKLERWLVADEADRQELQQGYAYVQSRFPEAYRCQAELSALIERYQQELEVSLLRSFLMQIQAVLQHLRNTVDSLPEFSPPAGYQAITVLVQSPMEMWRQDKTASNSAYQVLRPLAARLSAEIQEEILRMLGMVSEISAANADAAEQEERPEARRISGRRVVSTVSRRLIDQEALLAAFLARMPSLDPAALATFKGVSRQEFLPKAESLLMTTLAESEARIQAGVTTVLASVEKSVLAFTGSALVGIEKRWEEMLAPAQQAQTGDRERFEAAIQQSEEALETLQEVYYNFQAALTTFLPPR